MKSKLSVLFVVLGLVFMAAACNKTGDSMSNDKMPSSESKASQSQDAMPKADDMTKSEDSMMHDGSTGQDNMAPSSSDTMHKDDTMENKGDSMDSMTK